MEYDFQAELGLDFRKFLSPDPAYPASRALRLIYLLPSHSVFKAKLAEKVRGNKALNVGVQQVGLELWERIRGRTPEVIYLDSLYMLAQATGGAKKITEHPMSPNHSVEQGQRLIPD